MATNAEFPVPDGCGEAAGAKAPRWHSLGPFTVFDLETTGMSAVHDRIVELAAVRIELDGTMTAYQSLVNPGRRIPYGAAAVHHITDEMVAAAPGFSEVAYRFLELAAGSTLVAHNARFDLSFLQESLARCGLPLWQGKTMDSLRLVRQTYKGLPSYSLQNLRRIFRLEDTLEGMQAHRAGADVAWTVQLLGKVLDELLVREAARLGRL
ncbi:PolC-type DNA polymerase III [Victivallis sp. Marseille-Q1083]|uniref:3'-5' exonuclease n=1 Tax=Victivallis sp. Marseille-Q1083 TaxID=2717288 RepID=UPI00158E23D5|nr:3'-5' exonuclease [Victivallis sp. Marseille-Q1083]